ncbi:hypothetical protein [Komagataeibacter xylinus]|nr:hypothetical protein [Komagataeibacter xylinus]GBQ75372.1 hypothetical protein AA15237_2071 [Komagataeibacter xylinus NBRC 15237]
MTEMKIEVASAIGIAFIPIACMAGMACFGIPHDDNFSNPEYAACRRRGNAMQDCIRHVRTTNKPTIRARIAGGKA